MKFTYFFCLFLIFCEIGYSQRVYPKTAIIRLEKFSSLNNDGILTFEIGVRMADCLSNIELNDMKKKEKKKNIWDKLHDWWWFKIRKIYDFEVSKTFTKEIYDHEYFLKDTDDLSEQIYMKCELIQLKSVFSRESVNRKLEINLYSKSGKKVYSKIFILNKNKLLENMEVRLGIEPS